MTRVVSCQRPSMMTMVMFTPQKTPPHTRTARAQPPQRHTAAGTAAPTTTDTGNTVPQRATNGLCSPLKGGPQAARGQPTLRCVSPIPHVDRPLMNMNTTKPLNARQHINGVSCSTFLTMDEAISLMRGERYNIHIIPLQLLRLES